MEILSRETLEFMKREALRMQNYKELERIKKIEKFMKRSR